MEMNNPRVESHVAQKNRRHKLRFQQNSGDMNHQQQQDHPHFSYNNPNVLPSEILTSITRNNNNNPQLLLPSGFVSQDCSNDVVYGNLLYTQEPVGDHWNTVTYSNAVPMNIDQRSLTSSYGYHQEQPHNFTPSPFYHNTLQQHHVTLALPPQNKNDSGINPSIPCWMNNSDHEQQPAKENNTTQGGLSLSLSSVPSLKDDQPVLHNSDPKSLMGFCHRNTGPLGPFTGYATILKNSKYIKPAQELLNGSCDIGYQTSCHDAYSHKILEEEISRAASDNCPVGSYGESGHEHASGRVGSGAESIRPEFHRKKARLLYMQEEVCRRYKQYLQQMQMVISSFETVAGLSGATPYVCLALKAVSRHFHHVKKVISEQLSQMRKTVGEGLCSSSNVGKTSDANATSSSRLKSGGGGSGGFFVPQQPVWRPQRGLPERAITVLKTWLFDHFLHPYPSDADKHMLATQTGLTRNQVSNWFINARVRIWKPMVEEIHTLETKGLAEGNSSHPHQSDGQDSNWNMDMSTLPNTQPPECSRNPGSVNVNLSRVDEPHDHDKQARPEYQNNIPLSSMDRLMSIMPYPRATFDTTGLGPVSLTLGLRQNAEHVQQLQQHFGGQLIHDFVG